MPLCIYNNIHAYILLVHGLWKNDDVKVEGSGIDRKMPAPEKRKEGRRKEE